MKTFIHYNPEKYLTPDQLAERKQKLKFRANLELMYKDKYPQTDFCLSTNDPEVKEAYKRMIKNPNSDVH